MQKKRSIRIISIVMILVLICISITYLKNDSKEVLATTKEFNSENLQDSEHMHLEEDASGDKVPVPNGYVGSKVAGESEIDTGYVIYEGTDEVNDSNVEEAQKTRNQYVWIPVPDASKMYGTDANGKKWGKLYNFTTSTGNNIDEVTGATPLNWSESDGIIKISSKTQYREPDVILGTSTAYDMDSKIKELGLGIGTTHQFLLQLEKEFNSMVESVEKYGGFYIGRYETGDLNKEIVVVTKSKSDISNQTWYTFYNKCKTLSANNENIGTGMIWKSQFDRTLMWLIESKNKTKEEIYNDFLNFGNYKDSTFEYIDSRGNLNIKNKGLSIRIPTGSTEYTKVGNIYDLFGNLRECTMTAVNQFSRVTMGGGAYDSRFGTIFGTIILFPTSHSGDTRMSSNVIYKMMIQILILLIDK